MILTKEQIAQVKAKGFLINRGTQNFSGRIVSAGGVYSADDMTVISDCAKKYGNGRIVFTSRLSAEIVGIPYEKIDEACEYVSKFGLSFGGTGAKVRPLTSCKGTTCVYGNIDTQTLTQKLHNRFYIELGDIKLPHKFKISVGGCPNSCMKPSLNDVGIEGRAVFTFDPDKCRACVKCAVLNSCPSKSVSKKDGKAFIDTDKCLHCGVCVGKCPFNAVPKDAERLCAIFVGGTWGKSKREGTALNKLFTVDEVPETVEKIMLWYKKHGYKKERLGKTCERIGISEMEREILSDELLYEREKIIAADIPDFPKDNETL